MLVNNQRDGFIFRDSVRVVNVSPDKKLDLKSLANTFNVNSFDFLDEPIDLYDAISLTNTHPNINNYLRSISYQIANVNSYKYYPDSSSSSESETYYEEDSYSEYDDDLVPVPAPVHVLIPPPAPLHAPVFNNVINFNYRNLQTRFYSFNGRKYNSITFDTWIYDNFSRLISYNALLLYNQRNRTYTSFIPSLFAKAVDLGLIDFNTIFTKSSIPDPVTKVLVNLKPADHGPLLKYYLIHNREIFDENIHKQIYRLCSNTGIEIAYGDLIRNINVRDLNNIYLSNFPSNGFEIKPPNPLHFPLIYHLLNNLTWSNIYDHLIFKLDDVIYYHNNRYYPFQLPSQFDNNFEFNHSDKQRNKPITITDLKRICPNYWFVYGDYDRNYSGMCEFGSMNFIKYLINNIPFNEINYNTLFYFHNHIRVSFAKYLNDNHAIIDAHLRQFYQKHSLRDFEIQSYKSILNVFQGPLQKHYISHRQTPLKTKCTSWSIIRYVVKTALENPNIDVSEWCIYADKQQQYRYNYNLITSTIIKAVDYNLIYPGMLFDDILYRSNVIVNILNFVNVHLNGLEIYYNFNLVNIANVLTSLNAYDLSSFYVRVSDPIVRLYLENVIDRYHPRIFTDKNIDYIYLFSFAVSTNIVDIPTCILLQYKIDYEIYWDDGAYKPLSNLKSTNQITLNEFVSNPDKIYIQPKPNVYVKLSIPFRFLMERLERYFLIGRLIDFSCSLIDVAFEHFNTLNMLYDTVSIPNRKRELIPLFQNLNLININIKPIIYDINNLVYVNNIRVPSAVNNTINLMKHDCVLTQNGTYMFAEYLYHTIKSKNIDLRNYFGSLDGIVALMSKKCFKILLRTNHCDLNDIFIYRDREYINIVDLYLYSLYGFKFDVPFTINGADFVIKLIKMNVNGLVYMFDSNVNRNNLFTFDRYGHKRNIAECIDYDVILNDYYNDMYIRVDHEIVYRNINTGQVSNLTETAMLMAPGSIYGNDYLNKVGYMIGNEFIPIRAYTRLFKAKRFHVIRDPNNKLHNKRFISIFEYALMEISNNKLLDYIEIFRYDIANKNYEAFSNDIAYIENDYKNFVGNNAHINIEHYIRPDLSKIAYSNPKRLYKLGTIRGMYCNINIKPKVNNKPHTDSLVPYIFHLYSELTTKVNAVLKYEINIDQIVPFGAYLTKMICSSIYIDWNYIYVHNGGVQKKFLVKVVEDNPHIYDDSLMTFMYINNQITRNDVLDINQQIDVNNVMILLQNGNIMPLNYHVFNVLTNDVFDIINKYDPVMEFDSGDIYFYEDNDPNRKHLVKDIQKRNKNRAPLKYGNLRFFDMFNTERVLIKYLADMHSGWFDLNWWKISSNIDNAMERIKLSAKLLTHIWTSTSAIDYLVNNSEFDMNKICIESEPFGLISLNELCDPNMRRNNGSIWDIYGSVFDVIDKDTCMYSDCYNFVNPPNDPWDNLSKEPGFFKRLFNVKGGSRLLINNFENTRDLIEVVGRERFEEIVNDFRKGVEVKFK